MHRFPLGRWFLKARYSASKDVQSDPRDDAVPGCSFEHTRFGTPRNSVTKTNLTACPNSNPLNPTNEIGRLAARRDTARPDCQDENAAGYPCR